MDRAALLVALSELHSERDASRLFALLGYVPDDHADGEARVVARWQGFQVLALRSVTPQVTARALCRRLATDARRAMAVSLGPEALAITAPRLGTPGITPLLVVPRRAPPALALQLLQELAPRPRDNGLAHALRVAQVLSTERVGERFFQMFRTVLERMTSALPRRATGKERRTVVLIALTRVLFLYFVQAKGWLDGRDDYLRTALDDALAAGRHFHRDVLHPLFFGTLNRAPALRSGRLRLGAIPYLNGGLFEPHPVERRVGPGWLPNRLWRDAFDELFERFRFCVREADEVNAVAPDMLGHVFERIMEDGERRATGTFYTPELVVRQMVDAALETAMVGVHGMDPDTARRVVGGVVSRHQVETSVAALRELCVLDPAVGSGAFLLGTLERLTEIRCRLEPLPDAGARCRLRRDILRDNLFGVDRNPVAVRLAELRLWLALVADDPTADVHAITPLPNLDGVLRQGDSLFDPVSAARVLGVPAAGPPGEAARAVADARAALYQAPGQRRPALARRLRTAELDLAGHILAQARAAAGDALRDLAALASGRDLFGRRSGLSPGQRHRYRRLRRHWAALRLAQRALADGEVPFFSFDVHAPDIVARGGFAIVMGNPPWVRAERLAPGTRRALADRFPWWRAPAGTGFRHQPDLAVAFLERSLELTRPGGAVALLLPSKVASAGYGETARAQLVRETTVTYLHRVPDRQAAAFGATTYPLALVVKNQAPSPQHAVRLGFGGEERVQQQALNAPGPWILVPDRTRGAIERFLDAATPLARLAAPALGLKTGADRLFTGRVRSSGAELSLVELDGGLHEVETSLLRPVVQGRDIKPFQATSTRVILWTYRGAAPLERLPPRAAAYFRARTDRLRRRADFGGGPPWALFRLPAGLPGWRVTWPDIARRPMAVLLEAAGLETAVPVNTCYVARVPDRETALAISAILNSVWALAAVRATADEARGGYRRVNARVIERIPVPGRAACERLAPLAARAHQRHHVEQDELDDAVADVLGLSAPDRDLLRRFAAHPG